MKESQGQREWEPARKRQRGEENQGQGKGEPVGKLSGMGDGGKPSVGGMGNQWEGVSEGGRGAREE